MFLGLPVGIDSVYWNAHRFYGKLRLYLMFSNWEVVDVIGAENRITDGSREGDWKNQPMFVLRKKPVKYLPGKIPKVTVSNSVKQ